MFLYRLLIEYLEQRVACAGERLRRTVCGDLIGVFHYAVLCIEVRRPAIAFAILEHQAGNDAVEQVKDTGGIPVDECRGHAYKEL